MSDISYQYTSLRSLGVGVEVSGDDGWINVVGICHILSLTVAVRYVTMMDGLMQNDDVMIDSDTTSERHLIVGHGSMRC